MHYLEPPSYYNTSFCRVVVTLKKPEKTCIGYPTFLNLIFFRPFKYHSDQNIYHYTIIYDYLGWF